MYHRCSRPGGALRRKLSPQGGIQESSASLLPPTGYFSWKAQAWGPEHGHSLQGHVPCQCGRLIVYWSWEAPSEHLLWAFSKHYKGSSRDLYIKRRLLNEGRVGFPASQANYQASQVIQRCLFFKLLPRVHFMSEVTEAEGLGAGVAFALPTTARSSDALPRSLQHFFTISSISPALQFHFPPMHPPHPYS